MKTIASLLVRAKTLKRFGSQAIVEKQIAKIIEHPDFENLCNLLESLQKLSFVSKANEEFRVEAPTDLEDELTEQDVLDLDLDISLDNDEEVAGEEEIVIIDDLGNEDSTIESEMEDCAEDLEIIIDEEPAIEESKDEAEATLAQAKLAKAPKKIVVSKASILAKKKNLG